jgi:RNA polymerase sigma factor (sigma-70 family)
MTMHEGDIVAAMMAGDPAGLAAAYDAYAEGLYVYCLSLLGEPADSADAAQDTFMVAAAKVSGLREPGRFRAWLYAIARNECHRRLRARASSAPLDEAGETTGEADDPGADAEHAELRDLVHAALSGLNPGEREIIELNLRSGIGGADLADVLGVSRNQAHALASRARSQFETSLGVLLVARSGREFCPDLAGILDGWGGELTVLLRKRVKRHIDHCTVCGERRRRELNPTVLLFLLPIAVLPVSLREQVLHLAADVTRGSLAYRARIVHRAGNFASSGFPPQVTSPPLVHWHGMLGRAAGAKAATVAVAVLLGGALLLLPQHTGAPSAAGPQPPQPGSSGSSGAGPRPSVSPSGPTPGRSPGKPGVAAQPNSRLAFAGAHPAPIIAGAGAAPPPALPAPALPAPAVSGSVPVPVSQPSVAVSQPSSSSSSPGPPPLVTGTLSVSPRLVRVGLTITLTAEGGPVSYSIGAPAVLVVSPSSGSLKAGASVTVRVSLGLGQLLSGDVTLIVNPGSIPVTVVPLPLGILPGL